MTIAVSALVACSGKGGSAAPRPLDTTPVPGSVVVTDAQAGFALDIPMSWKQLPTSIGNFDSAVDALRAQSGAADKLSVGLTQLKSVVRNGAAVVAIDPDTGATANLIVLDAGGQDATEIAKASAKQLRDNGATDITQESVVVDGVKAVRQRFRTPFPGDAGPVDLGESQLYVVRRSQAFILTLTGDSPALDGIAASLKLA